MVKKKSALYIIFLSLIFTVVDTHAQKYTYSPYSRYGIGDLEQRGYGRNTAMGSVGIALRSNKYLNDINPASYSSMDSSSFFFEAGIKGFNQNMSTTENSASFRDLNFEFFAIGFPIAKWGAATLGIRPVSGTGYNFATTSENPFLGRITQSASGTGSLTRAYTGLSVKPFKYLAVGFHFSYVFGNLTSINEIEYLDHPHALSYGRKQTNHVNDVFFDFGLQAYYPINEKNTLTIGATFSPRTPLNGYTEALVARGTTIEEEGELFVDSDTIFYKKSDFTSSITMPLSYGVGLAYNYKNKLTVAADYSVNGWNDVTFHDEYTKTTKRSRYAVGMEYIPNNRNPKTYFSRINYRLGTYYLKDYLVINNYQIKDFGMSFGAGFPLKRSKTSLNLSFQLGRRGTTDYNLVKERYFNIYLDITLYEMWFMKRKFE